MVDGKRRYKSDRKDYKVSVKLSEKDMDILKAALKPDGNDSKCLYKRIDPDGRQHRYKLS